MRPERDAAGERAWRFRFAGACVFAVGLMLLGAVAATSRAGDEPGPASETPASAAADRPRFFGIFQRQKASPRANRSQRRRAEGERPKGEGNGTPLAPAASVDKTWQPASAENTSVQEVLPEQTEDIQAPPSEPPIPLPEPSAGIGEVEPFEERELRTESAYSPKQLRKVTEILPYHDYTPGGRGFREEGPCRFLCPRPNGEPCQALEGAAVPACPEEFALGDEPYRPRDIPPSIFMWEASNMYSNPLYFQDIQLERYGHTYPHVIQPFVSAFLFAGQFLALPYQMTINAPTKKMYALGYYRPGSYAPHLIYVPPFNADAAVMEAAVATGLVFLLP